MRRSAALFMSRVEYRMGDHGNSSRIGSFARERERRPGLNNMYVVSVLAHAEFALNPRRQERRRYGQLPVLRGAERRHVDQELWPLSRAGSISVVPPMTSGRATEWEQWGMTVEPITRRDVGEPWPPPVLGRRGRSRVRTGLNWVSVPM